MIGVAHIALLLTVLVLQAWIPVTTAEPFETFGDKVTSKVTVVSGHWVVDVSHTKHPIEYYRVWWENAMVLNCPYVVFGQDLDVIQKIKTIREKHSLPTVYVYRNITEHMSPRFHRFKRRYVSREVPSKEVAVIWLDKIFMIQEAIRLNPFNSEWFAWNDAGNAAFRTVGPVTPRLNPLIPWPHPNALAALPKDKFIYTLSWIPWNKHYIAGTAFVYHKDIQETLAERFMIAFHACLLQGAGWNKYICGSDQVVLSHIRNKHESFFHQIGYGYGHLINRLFLDHDPVSNVTEMKDLCYEQNGNVALLKSFRKPLFDRMCAEAWGIPAPPVGDQNDHTMMKKMKRSKMDKRAPA